MTTKTIGGHYPGGYSLKSAYNALNLTASATVGGSGVYAYQSASVDNLGVISGADSHYDVAVNLYNGGTVTNGAFFEPGHIYGYVGVVTGNYQANPALGVVVNYSYIGGRQTGIFLTNGGRVTNSGGIRGIYGYGVASGSGVATIANSGTIEGARVGVEVRGTVTNGSLASPVGLIEGGYGTNGSGQVTNFATISGASIGVEIIGALTNGAISDANALIRGQNGVSAPSDGPTTVSNFGTIMGATSAAYAKHTGVYLQGGGVVTNGAGSDSPALIEGYNGVDLAKSGSVINYGLVEGSATASGAYGVVLGAGGNVANGSSAYLGGKIEGFGGVKLVAAATLTNFGRIYGSSGAAVTLFDGGRITNGSAAASYALLLGGDRGVFSLGAATTVTNFGSIEASAAFSVGVYDYGAGARLTNGSSGDGTALVSGYGGLEFERSGTVVNFGTIMGRDSAGAIVNGGAVTNNGPSALIQGSFFGVEALDKETVRNFGTMQGLGPAGAYGVALKAGGQLTNGSATIPTAAIAGYGGAELLDGATATNLGTIQGVGQSGGAGILLGAGGKLTNGAAREADGLIEGYTGVSVGPGAAATLTNFGAIKAQGGAAVQFNSAADVLVAEGGSSFSGAINGDGGTIVLANGTGSATLLTGDSLTVSGDMATTTFSNFGKVEVGAGAVFTLSGGAVASGQSLIDQNSLTVAGPLANSGTLEVDKGLLTVDGAVSGSGQAAIGGGKLYFKSGFSQNVAFTGVSGVLELAQSRSYGGSISGFSRTGGTSLDLRDIAFKSAGEATFSGNASGGTLTVTDGTHTAHIALVGDYAASAFIASSDGHGGTTVVDPAAPATVTPPHGFIAAMAGLGVGAGSFAGRSEQHWREAPLALAGPRIAPP